MRGTCRTYVNTSWSFVPKISVGCDGSALVIVLNEAGIFPANLGGITGPGSRPKKDRNRAFLHIEEAPLDAPDDEYRDRRKLL